jgi:hypothetical protein
MRPELNRAIVDRRRPAWRPAVLFLGTLALLPGGCSEELGPFLPPVTQVKGRVTEGGRPITGGWVEFFPLDGCVGNLRSARLRPDGSFEADKVAVGFNLIRLVNTNISSVPARMIVPHAFNQYTSPIRRTIPSQLAAPLLIDVFDEAVQFSNSRPRRVLPAMPQRGESR